MLTRLLAAGRLLPMALLSILLGGCGTEPPPPTPQVVILESPSPTPALPIDDRIRESYRRIEPAARKENILRVTEAFLRHAASTDMDDQSASVHYTQAAFSSGSLALSDPAFIRRQDQLTVVGLPDGLGLYLYDLEQESGTQPLELSPWTIGLGYVGVIWKRQEIGLSYATLGSDGVVRIHFILVDKPEESWRVAWFSDEDPDWWFNAYDATVLVEADLSSLIVTGKSNNTTDVFDESGQYDDEVLARKFRVIWARDEDGYLRMPSVGAFPDRQTWLWSIAEPSPYATLIEFIERLRRYDEAGAANLAGSADVVTASMDFGLYLPDRQYQILSYSEDIIIFRDRRGAFIATFDQRDKGVGIWQIESIKPLGVAVPEPTPIIPNDD